MNKKELQAQPKHRLTMTYEYGLETKTIDWTTDWIDGATVEWVLSMVRLMLLQMSYGGDTAKRVQLVDDEYYEQVHEGADLMAHGNEF